jgi:GTPase
VDISHPNFQDHINVVNQTLVDIKAADKPTIMVFNKIDAYHFIEKEEDDLSAVTRENLSLEELKNSWIAKEIKSDYCFISAINKENVDELRKEVFQKVKELHSYRYPNKI